MRIWPVLLASGLLLSVQACGSDDDNGGSSGPTPDGGEDAEAGARPDGGDAGGSTGATDGGGTAAEASAPDAHDGAPAEGGQGGDASTAGADGGEAGRADAGGDAAALTPEAQQGLAISPVTVTTAGAGAAELELIGRGSYLVNAVGACNDCHQMAPADGGPPKFLAGGQMFPAGPAGAVFARNLTPDAATGLKLSEAQFIEAMRTGADFHAFELPTTGADGGVIEDAGPASDATVPALDGASLDGTIGADGGAIFGRLLVMPWPSFRWMTDHDLRSIYAYLKAIPGVSNAVPNDVKVVLPPFPAPTTYDEGVLLADGGGRPLPDENVDVDNSLRGLAIQPLGTPANFNTLPAAQQQQFARGSYLVNAVAACNDCHTNPDRDPVTLKINTDAYLSGGRVFEVPPPLRVQLRQTRTMSADLTGMNNGFNHTYVEFKAMIDSGKHVEDQAPSDAGALPIGWPMPWQTFKNMTENDLQSVYTYFTTVPRRTGANDKVTQGTAWYCTAAADCAPFGGGTCNVATQECLMTCTGTGLVDGCGACQTCGTGACVAPDTTSACLVNGIP